MWDPLAVLLLLLPSAFCFPREKTTENPGMPDPPKQRRPTHISEFTDPDTGLNPFLDLEEGRTSEGRTNNVMEDERRPPPSFDFDLVEGDAPDRSWDLGEPPRPHPKPDAKNSGDFHMGTTARIPPTTVRSFAEGKTPPPDVAARDVETRPKVKKEERGSSYFAQGTVIYATSAVAVLTMAALLTGIWWRRKLKASSQSTVSAAENGDAKS